MRSLSLLYYVYCGGDYNYAETHEPTKGARLKLKTESIGPGGAAAAKMCETGLVATRACTRINLGREAAMC